MTSLEKPKVFIITYDEGSSRPKTRNVSHELYNSEWCFRKQILSMKCLHCNFESNFEEIENGN